MSAKSHRERGALGPNDARAALAIAAWSSVTLIAAVVTSRRFEGKLVAETGAALPCLSATAALFLSLLAYALWSAVDTSARSVGIRIIAVAVTVIPPLGIGSAVGTPFSITTVGYLAALSIVAALVIFFRKPLRSALVPRPFDSPVAMVPPVSTQPNVDDEENESDHNSLLVQSMTRFRLPDGRDTVEGTIRAQFGPGEKLTVAHVLFVPPLIARPEAECYFVTDFTGRVRVAAAEAYGLRIEVRRTDGGSGTAVDVVFRARVPVNQATAA